MKKLMLIMLLLTAKMFAHKDTTYVKTFDNVVIITTTGYAYEEVNKTFIIGQYAAKLASSLVYKDSIILNFRHSYTEEMRSGFNAEKNENFLKLYYRKSSFNILKTLNLLEYSILNSINLDTLNESDVRQIEEKEPSDVVKKILNIKIFRPINTTGLNINDDFSYYTLNNKYYIYYKNEDEVKLIVDDLYQLNSVNQNLIVFDTKRTFYFIDIRNNFVSSQAKFRNDKFYKPYALTALTKNIISIKLSDGYDNERLMLYFIDKKRLKKNI